MKINLVTTSGSKFNLEGLTTESTLGELRNKIKQYEKKLFDIIFQGEVLNDDDEKRLSEFDFNEDDDNTIQLTTSKRGGEVNIF
jgi:hypothetical protein